MSLQVILPETVTELCASTPATPVLRTFVQYLIAFFSRPKTASDVICGKFIGAVVRDKRVKFRDPRLNRSREIPPKAVCGGILDRFFKHSDNCQPEVASVVISGMAVQYVGMDVCVKFGDSRLKLSEASFWPFFEGQQLPIGSS